jgi:hypothetical protein
MFRQAQDPGPDQHCCRKAVSSDSPFPTNHAQESEMVRLQGTSTPVSATSLPEMVHTIFLASQQQLSLHKKGLALSSMQQEGAGYIHITIHYPLSIIHNFVGGIRCTTTKVLLFNRSPAQALFSLIISHQIQAGQSKRKENKWYNEAKIFSTADGAGTNPALDVGPA